MSGKKVICPKCRGKVKVPDLDSALGTEKQAVIVKQEGSESDEAAVKVASESKPATASSKKQRSKVPEVLLASLLPPSVSGEVGVEPKQEVPLPQVPAAPGKVPAEPPPLPPPISFPGGAKATADSRAIQSLLEPVRTPGSGGNQRRNEQIRARRRFRKNLIMWSLCAIVMVVVMIVLMNRS